MYHIRSLVLHSLSILLTRVPLYLCVITEAFLWELAREQLNIVNASTPHQKCTVARANKYKLFLESFGEVAVGVGLQNDAQKHYALYEAVWKAANDNIRANMLSKTWSDKEVEYYKEKRNFKQHHAFTFVREPVARFESAIREYFVRCPKELDLVSHHPMIENNSTTAVSEVSPAFIAAELDRILDTCNARHCSAFQFIPQRHMFPQSAMLTFWERKHMYPQFIGHLETFDQDWHAVDAHFGVEDHVYDKTLGGHESNTRFYGIKESLAQLFEEQPAYLRAVCILNFFDFHCFDYKFPPPCHGVQEQVLAFITDLLRPYAKPRRIAKVRIARPGDNNV